MAEHELEHELEWERRHGSQNKGRFEIIRRGIEPHEVEVKLLQAEEKVRKLERKVEKIRLEKLYKRPISETQPSEEAKDGKRRLVFRVLEWGWKGCGGYGGKRMIMIKH